MQTRSVSLLEYVRRPLLEDSMLTTGSEPPSLTVLQRTNALQDYNNFPAMTFQVNRFVSLSQKGSLPGNLFWARSTLSGKQKYVKSKYLPSLVRTPQGRPLLLAVVKMDQMEVCTRKGTWHYPQMSPSVLPRWPRSDQRPAGLACARACMCAIMHTRTR